MADDKNADKDKAKDADAKAEGEAVAEGAPKKKGLLGLLPKINLSRKTLMFVVAAAVLVVALGAGAYFFLFSGGEEEQVAETGHGEAGHGEGGHGEGAHGEGAPHPVFFEVPDILVNVASDGDKPAFLKLSVSLELEGEEEAAKAAIEPVMPRGPAGLTRWALGLGKNAIVTTNFRPFEAVILHLVTRVQPDMPVVWMDNGYNTEATYRYADEVTRRLALNLKTYLPLRTRAHREAVEGPTPALDDPRHESFTQEVKLEPFARALREQAPQVWFTDRCAPATAPCVRRWSPSASTPTASSRWRRCCTGRPRTCTNTARHTACPIILTTWTRPRAKTTANAVCIWHIDL